MCDKKKNYTKLSPSLWMGSLWWKWTSHKCGGGVLDAVCVCVFSLYTRALDVCVCVCVTILSILLSSEKLLWRVCCACALVRSLLLLLLLIQSRAGPDQFEHPTARKLLHSCSVYKPLYTYSLIWIVAVHIQSKCSHHSSHLTRFFMMMMMPACV